MKILFVPLVVTTIIVAGCTTVETREHSPAARARPPVSTSESKQPAEVPKSEAIPVKREEVNRARVVIDFPARLESRSSYYNIGGPVWVFTIKFKEINGVAAEIKQKRMKIYGTSGSVWGDYSFGNIYDSDTQKTVTLNLPAKGEASYTSWVNSPDCNLCDAQMVLEYEGQDANGSAVSCEVRFILQK